MISKQAVRAFLERDRADWRGFKKLSAAELRTKRDELPIRPPIWKRLQHHQRVCFLLAATNRYFGLFCDTGMGKSLLTISLGRYFNKLGEANHILILCPNKINTAEWTRELKKWGQRERYAVLRGSSQEKWEQLNDTDALFVVTTYAGFIRMVCEKVPGKGRKQKLVPVAKLVQQMVDKFDGFVCDESTNVASRTALATRVLRQLRKKAKFAYALTGTPFGRDPTALWAQVHLLDQGQTLGETLGLFRAAFFNEKRNYWGGYEYEFRKKMQPQLNRFLAARTIRYEVEESDLPEFIPIVKEVSLPHDAGAYADKAREALRAARGNFHETRNAFLRMRQISSGFIGYQDDDTGKRAEIEFNPNPKLELLVALVESIPDKVIVFHDFIFSGGMICRELTKAKISWARISGETKGHDRILADFDRASGPQVLVLNNKMTFGPNLQAAKYGIWFEAPCSCLERKQGRRRFERQGSQHKKVFGYDLVVKNTYDQRILDAHAQGEDLFRAIVEGRVKI